MALLVQENMPSANPQLDSPYYQPGFSYYYQPVPAPYHQQAVAPYYQPYVASYYPEEPVDYGIYFNESFDLISFIIVLIFFYRLWSTGWPRRGR